MTYDSITETYKKHKLEKDIKLRVEKDFGENAEDALKLLSSLENNVQEFLRVARCVVYLAKGSIDGLKKAIREAKADYRDVIIWAESYSLEFKEPFKN